MALYAVLCACVADHRTAAAAIGRRESTVRAWFTAARTAGWPLPSYPRINATIVALNVCWNREKLGIRPGEAARTAGFKSTGELDRYLKWNLGFTARQLSDAGAPATLLAQIAAWFVRR